MTIQAASNCLDDSIWLKNTTWDSSLTVVDSIPRLKLDLTLPVNERTYDISGSFENLMPEDCPLINYRISNVSTETGNLTENEYLQRLFIRFDGKAVINSD